MNILTKTNNHLIYTYHRKRRDFAVFMMKKYDNTSDVRWQKWFRVNLESLRRCKEIPLH